MAVLLKNNDPGAAEIMFQSLGEMEPDDIQRAGMTALSSFKGDDPRIVPALRNALHSGNFNMILPAIQIAQTRKIKELIPDLQALKTQNQFFGQIVDPAIAAINAP
jgi:hypothetical protein